MGVKKKRTVPGLYLRPDGVYEKILTIDGKRVAFRSSEPNEVWNKIANHKNTPGDTLPFEEVAGRWWVEHTPSLEYNTVRGYQGAYRRVTKAFSGKPISSITAEELSNYIKRFSVNHAQKTVKNVLLIIRLIFDYAGVHNIIKTNPVLFVRIPKGLPKTKRRMPTDEETNIIKNSQNLPFGLFFFLVLYTGCRKGEALALQWRDIDFSKKRIHISKSVYFEGGTARIKEPKTDSGNREVILLDKLSKVLLPLQGSPDEYLFAENGTLLSSGQYERRVAAFCKQAGVQVTAHRLRHAFVTMLYEARPILDEKLIQYFVGHAQLSTTMDIYAELRYKRIADAAKGLEKLDIDTEYTQ